MRGAQCYQQNFYRIVHIQSPAFAVKEIGHIVMLYFGGHDQYIAKGHCDFTQCFRQFQKFVI